MQSIVHHHTSLIALRGLLSGQSEKIIRLSTKNSIQQHIKHMRVDNKLQQTKRALL